MRLTQFTDYSLRVLIYLGLRQGAETLVTIQELAGAYRVSRHHLRAVVHQLAAKGYVSSVRGKGGGLRLARAAAHITLGDVVRHTESDFYIVDCFRPGRSRCPISASCTLQHLLGEAADSFLAVLDRHTLADIIQQRTLLARDLRMALA